MSINTDTTRGIEFSIFTRADNCVGNVFVYVIENLSSESGGGFELFVRKMCEVKNLNY